MAKSLSQSIQVTSLREDLWVAYHDYNTFLKLKSNWEPFEVVHMNSWFDIFYLLWKEKSKKIIFESHALHPGLNNKYARAIIESPFLRLFVLLFWWMFTMVFKKNIKNADLYLVSTPGFIESARAIDSSAIWLPNPVEIPEKIEKINTLWLSPSSVNIFYPTGLRNIKNPEAALSLLIKLCGTYPHMRIYMFEPLAIPQKLTASIQTLQERITWLPRANQEKMREYYLHDWDLVIGSLYSEKPYAILNMIELESMAYELPILAIDHYEILHYPLEEIQGTALKLISDRAYRKEYTKKNLAYLKEVHAPEKVGALYQNLLESKILP